MKAGLMQAWESYVQPLSIDEALEELSARGEAARVLSGGTDLLIELTKKGATLECVVDVTRIPGLRGISRRADGGLTIGAATTHAEIAASELVRRSCLVLASAAGAVGSRQIRSQGTIGGNLVNAQPAADTAVALAALDATVEIAGPSSGRRRTVPWQDLYTGVVGRSRVDSSREIVTRVFLPAGAGGSASSFQRLARRKALALPMLNCAVVLAVEARHIEWCHIAMGPVATTPFRCAAAEAMLTGLSVDDEVGQRAAADVVTGEVCPRDSRLRGSAQYRCVAGGNMAFRGIREALERAQRRDDSR